METAKHVIAILITIVGAFVTFAGALLVLDMLCYLVLVARKNDFMRQAKERLEDPHIFSDVARELRQRTQKRIKASERWEKILLAPLKIFWRFL
ncbi:MAG: hypothetical protein Q8P01_05580 [bacterium]|nr:hypothetical protein [bacterium]